MESSDLFRTPVRELTALRFCSLSGGSGGLAARELGAELVFKNLGSTAMLLGVREESHEESVGPKGPEWPLPYKRNTTRF